MSYTVVKANALPPWGVVGAIYGSPGCLAGTTPLLIRRGKHTRIVTIATEYKRLRGIPGGYGWHRRDLSVVTELQSLVDQHVVWKPVHNIVKSGVQQTYKLHVEDRPFIVATSNHRFLTPDGYCTLAGLKHGMSLVVLGNLIRPEPVFRAVRQEVSANLHPYASYRMIGSNGPYGRIRYSKAVLEATMNGLSVDEFLYIVNNSLSKVKELTFLDPTLEVHHKDENPFNDEPDNLVALSKSDHARLHGIKNAAHFGQGRWSTKLAKVLNVLEDDVVDTYDVQMEDQSAPNFLVHGVVTHNSGKTTFLSDAADSPYGSPLLVADAEGGARAFAHRDDIDVASFVDPDADGSGWQDYEDFVNDLILQRKGLDKYKTILVDNASELLSLCIRNVVKTVSRGPGVGPNDRPDQRDWNIVTMRMLLMVRKLRDYGRASGTNIFFIAWQAPEHDETTGITKTDVAFNPSLARQFPGIVDFVGHLTVVNPTTRRLSFEASRTTAAKFRKSRSDAAQKIPGRFEYTIDDKPLVDILAVLKGGADWPTAKYAKNARNSEPSTTSATSQPSK